MSYLRLLLIPVYLVCYFTAEEESGYGCAAAVIAVSGLTDMLDGKIARRFNMITEWGKFIDPVADKLTLAAIALSMAFRHVLMGVMFGVYVVKELYMFCMGAYMLKRNYAKAYGDYRKLSEMPLTADIPDVQEGLALVSSHVGRLDEAEKAYEKLLGKNATPITRINLAELYIVRGKYEKALKLLDSDQLLRSADRFMKCISSYLAASALLASGKNAEAPMKVFYELLPQFKEKSEETDWDTALFENWLKNAELPSGAKEKIADMTGRAGETFRVK